MGSKGKDTRTPSSECKIIRNYLVSAPKGASNPPKHVLTSEHACAVLQDMAKCALQYLRGACCRLERCDEAHLDTNLVAVRMVGGLVECGVSPLTIGWLCESTTYKRRSIRCVCGACGRPTLWLKGQNCPGKAHLNWSLRSPSAVNRTLSVAPGP